MPNLLSVKDCVELLGRAAEDQIRRSASRVECRHDEIQSKLRERYIDAWKVLVDSTGAVTVHFACLPRSTEIRGSMIPGRLGARSDVWHNPVATSSATFAWDRNVEPWIENSVLETLKDSALNSVALQDIRAAISTIKFNFSLNFSQLAEVLRVTRQAVYSWLDEEQGVQIQEDNRRRIEQLEFYANLWWSNAGRRFPKELLNSSLGLLLLKLLKEEVPNDGFIRRVFEKLSAEMPSKRRFLNATGLEPVPEGEPLTMDEFMD